jgi:WD40 repeat protein/tetratricopeptide (TPR) repeat protein/tRNA A-37 threonylcarbamoyl transferase component Bud32
MADATPRRPDADRNLLFGILALQLDFVSRDELIAAMHAWVLDKAMPLGQLLVARHAIQASEPDVLDALVAKHLERHGGDLEQSLAAAQVPVALRDDLHRLGDRDLQESLAQLSTPNDGGTGQSATATYKQATAGGRYQAVRLHGRGGLGEVFVAKDQELGREVALKEMRPEHADDPLSRSRFVREAEITGGLEHPGVVPVYGLCQYGDGRPAYAMRFIRGETLKEAIARYHAGDAGWTLRTLLTRYVAVCNTVAYAHSRGVLHRDLKPSNVMLGRYGETLLVDWGLAKPTAGPSADADVPEPPLLPASAPENLATQAGAAVGTPAYMSPEQALGRLDQLGPASDIYSLGATLYTLLTGRPPLEGKDTAELLRKTQRGDWLPPRRVRPDVPPALDAICRRAMAARPDERYGSALELAADVERWLADEPVTAYAEPWPVRARRWMRRHRPLVSTAVGVVLVALVATTVGLLLVSGAWDREADARRTAEEKATEAGQQKETADRRREEARFNQYVAQMNLVQREYEANNMDRVRELLEAQVPREPDVNDYRNFEWYFWRRMSHREVQVLRGHMGWTSHVEYSADGARLTTWGRDGTETTIRVLDAATGRELLKVQGDHAAYSPDERWLATFHGDTVRVCNMVRCEERCTFKVRVGGFITGAFSPDGQRIASAGYDTDGAWTVGVWDTSNGQELLTFKVAGGSDSPVISRDGRRLLAMGSDGKARAWDAANGKELPTLKVLQELLTLKRRYDRASVRYSPDGQRRATGGSDGTVRVWDTVSDMEVLTLKGHARPVNTVEYSPDGRHLTSRDEGDTVLVWDAVSGRKLLQLQGQNGTVSYDGVRYSPDGGRLAVVDKAGTIRLYDARTGKVLQDLKGHRGQATHLAFSPDGRRLASVGFDGAVRVWNVAAGQDPLTLTGSDSHELAATTALVYSSDGCRLASAGGAVVHVWDTATGQERLTLKGHAGVQGLAYRRDGRQLASAADTTVRVWDAASGKELLVFRRHTGAVWSVAYSADGRQLASAGNDQLVRVWDAASGAELFTCRGHTQGICGVAYSPDGRCLASAGRDATLRVWDAASGTELRTLKGHVGAVIAVAWSPNGRQLASAGEDRTVRVWDAATGAELLTLRGHSQVVHSVAYSADGERIVSAALDRSARIWDAASGQELLSLKNVGPSGESGRHALFRPDGRQLATGDSGDTVRLWDAAHVPHEVVHRRALVMEVQSRFAELLWRDKVLAHLRQDGSLSEPDRTFALQVAEELPERLRDMARAREFDVAGRQAVNENNLDSAIAHFRDAIRFAPDRASFHNSLGWALQRNGDLDGAIAAHREAIRRDPNLALAHNNLGWALQRKGDIDGAIECYRVALRCAPKLKYALANLPRAERLREMLLGRAEPANPAEAVEFANLCTRPLVRRYTVAVRLLQRAFATDAMLENEIGALHRYDGARAAALAAAGHDVAAPAPVVEEWAYFTEVAHRWLHADLAHWSRQAKDPKNRPLVHKTLAGWKQDADLVAVRDGPWLAAMPANDRSRWQALWAEVDRTLTLATPKK